MGVVQNDVLPYKNHWVDPQWNVQFIIILRYPFLLFGIIILILDNTGIIPHHILSYVFYKANPPQKNNPPNPTALRRCDEEVALAAVTSDFTAFQHVPLVLKRHRAIALAAVTQSARIFRSLPEEVKADREARGQASTWGSERFGEDSRSKGFLIGRIPVVSKHR